MSETTQWGTSVIAAPWPGPRGPQGATGPPAPDAPADGVTWGRAPDAWVPVLPLSGGTLSNGLSFGSAVAPGDNPAELGRHVTLYESGSNRYGLAVTSGSLVHAATPGRWAFYVAGNQAFYVGAHATLQSVFSMNPAGDQRGYLWYDKQNGHLHFRGGNNFGFSQWFGDGPNGWGQHAASLNGLYVTGEVWCSGLGYRTHTGWISWRWDGTWILFRWNQAYEWPMANACDERLKQDIAPTTFDALSVVRRIRLYQFRWNLKQRRDAAPVGFVAQRLAEDFPHGAMVRAGKVRGARLVGSTDMNTMLATLARAVQQLDERANELRS